MDRILPDLPFIPSDGPFIRHVVASGAFRDHPLTLLDVGCSGGLDKVWREFEPAFAAHAIDPMPEEIARLRSSEQNPNVHYHCAFLSLPPDHPFVRLRGKDDYWHHNPWDRTSTAWGLRLLAERNPKPTNEDILQSNRWDKADGIEKTPTLTPVEFLARAAGARFDVVKIDVDGPDFELLVGLEERLPEVLCVCLEVNFFGSHRETDHTFHNVDRFMRRNGFALARLTQRPYSHSSLPGRFKYGLLAQTGYGRPLQGDAVYIRDLNDPEYSHLAARLNNAQLLKVACLYVLTGLPDCAAELLLTFRTRLQSQLDVDQALDMLTPLMTDGKVSYKEYLARFTSDMEGWFFPPYQPKSAASETPPAEPAPAAEPPLRVDVWRTGKFVAKLLMLAVLGIFFAEVASQGRVWPFALFLAGLFLWGGCWVMARIPNKKQALRKVLKAVLNGPGVHPK